MITAANVTASQLEYLVAVLDNESWKDAAVQVGVSPSALSQGLSELERRLGIPLFDRQGRRRIATAAAHEAGRHATRILAEMRELGRWAAEVRDGSAGQVSIGMIDTAAIHHFGDALVGFRNEHPDVTLRLLVHPSGHLLDLLAAGEVDAVVAVDPDDDARTTVTPLIDEPLYIYAPPGADTDEITGPWVGFPRASRTRALISRGLRDLGIAYDVVAESSQPAVLREMVQLGMGWCVLPETDAETEPHALIRANDTPVAVRTLSLVQRRDRTASSALGSLLTAITNQT
jgi:DNA-binding transcriptional LysR family regulator